MVSFKMFAGTNVGLRENNEDNFTVCPDLDKNEWIVPADNQQAIPLGKKGCVMVVADGMGGQNAGEVASADAIDTVLQMFAPEQLPVDIEKKPDAIKTFLKKVVYEADLRIKEHMRKDPDTDGMGSTIVIAWLVEEKLYVVWLGDSRAYSFIPNKGIGRLTKDHSYVQQLVDSGAITEEEAMKHPNSNVITRSLGDPSQKAKAGIGEYSVVNGEVILLCTDGLCGVCDDGEIGKIIEEEAQNLSQCKEHLTSAALAAGGSDNITVALLRVECDESNKEEENRKTRIFAEIKELVVNNFLVVLFSGFILACLCAAGYFFMKPEGREVRKATMVFKDPKPGERNIYKRYSIQTEGDVSTISLSYDKTLISINEVDSTISLKKRPKQEKEVGTFIILLCNKDTVGQVRLAIPPRKRPVQQLSSEEDDQERVLRRIEDKTKEVSKKETKKTKQSKPSETDESIPNIELEITPSNQAGQSDYIPRKK